MEFKLYTFIILVGFIFVILYNYSENQSYIEGFENTNSSDSQSSNFSIMAQVAKNTGLLSNLNDSVNTITSKINSLTSKEELFDSQIKSMRTNIANNSSTIEKVGKLAGQNKDALMTIVDQAKTKAGNIQKQRDEIQFK